MSLEFGGFILGPIGETQGNQCVNVQVGYWRVSSVVAWRKVSGAAINRAMSHAVLIASEEHDSDAVVGLPFREDGTREHPEDTRVPPIEIDLEWVSL